MVEHLMFSHHSLYYLGEVQDKGGALLLQHYLLEI
jgi:hypothetical protein